MVGRGGGKERERERLREYRGKRKLDNVFIS